MSAIKQAALARLPLPEKVRLSQIRWVYLVPVLAVLLFTLLSTMGLVFPNVSALAMAPFTRQAGSASALLGTMQYLIGCAVGALVSVFHDGTARPMTVMMAASGITGWVLMHRALRRA